MERVFATSDWHGNLAIAEKVFNFLKPTDKLIFLGDAIDRGQNSLKVAEMLLKDPRCLYLKGNHEDMAATALADLLEYGQLAYGKLSLRQWDMNGGFLTLEAILGDSENLEEKNIKKWQNIFSKLTDNFIYQNTNGVIIHCNHSGYTPTKEIIPYWNREHFMDPWPKYIALRDRIIVHGHTPVHFFTMKFEYCDINNKVGEHKEINVEDPTLLKYCGGHKINIDLGTHFSNKTVLLDLDTFEEFYFKKENENND